MAEQMELNDILTGDGKGDPIPKEPAKPAEPEAKAEAPSPEKPEKPEAPAVERPSSRRKQFQDKEMDARGMKRDPETGQFVPKEDKPAEPAAKAETKPEPKPEPTKEPEKPAAPQQDMTEKERAFLKAMHEERQKRQELERRLQAIEAAKQPADPGAPKTFWDDPEGALAKDRQERQREIINTKLGLTETFARQRHPDFDEKIEEFGQLVASTPGLREQWLSAHDPAEFAYTVGKNHLELKQVGSMEEMRAKIARETEARVRAQLEAEMKAKAEELARQRESLPPSLSEARATAHNRPVWGGPPPLDEIIGS